MSATNIPIVDTNAASATYRYRFDDIEFDESQHLLWRAGRPVDVERMPLQLLEIFVRRAGEVITRAELLVAVWQNRTTVENAVANAISKLRRALGETAGARLVNLPRVGYRLKGPVERLAVGRRHVREPGLAAGQPVPGREDYLLSRPFGKGAASNVWLAHHRQLKRTLVFKFARDGDQLAALKHEFTTCRLLVEELGQRPDLVAIEESNFSEAPYYLAYQSAGVDLPTWAEKDAHLALMSAAGRIALFLQIARAVAAAHSVAVLHRDLKPANVLIHDAMTADVESTPDARWRVRLIDFGSSLLLTPERLAALGVTALGMTVTEGGHPLLGSTPHYLAPEVLAGHKPTTTSDLYALGLILYQLLAGDLQRPLTTGWEHDIADPLLIDDLRAATEGRPERRLASVAQLVERLESLDERRARQAREAENARRMLATAERLKELRNRRPWMWALTICIALGAVCATWFGVRASIAQRQAERATARARAINDFLNLDVLQSPAPMRIAATRSMSMVDVLARASDRAAERFKDDVPVLAQVRRQLGDIYLRMFFLDQAEYQYLRVVALLEPSAPSDDPELLAARFGLAEALTARDRPGEAIAALEVAEHAAGTAALGGSSTVAERALRARVQVLMDDRRYSEALPYALRLVRLSDAPSDDVAFNFGLRFDARVWLCEIYARLDEPAEAAKLEQTLAAPPFNATGIGKVIHVRGELQRARALIKARRLDDAERTLVALRDASADSLEHNGLYRGRLYQQLFEVHEARGSFREALQDAAAAFEAHSTTLGEQHSLTTIARIDTALAELDLGHAAEALHDLEAARRRLDANGHYAEALRAVDLGRARALTQLGRSDEAVELLRARALIDR